MAARTKTTASMMPSAMDLKAGAGTSITAERLTRTVRPDRATALPAVSMVSATALTGLPCRASAARKRTTRKSA